MGDHFYFCYRYRWLNDYTFTNKTATFDDAKTKKTEKLIFKRT